MRIFVTGIDTNVGKTVVSSILVKASGYDYWKPIQSGDLKNSDTKKVKNSTNNSVKYFKERFRLNNPLSPHLSARMDGVKISLEDFELPKKEEIIIEGAGGILVPINDDGDTIIDLIGQLDTKVILVTKNYLGSINHTLMSCQLLNNAGVQILGIVVNGEANEETEKIISDISGVPIIGHVKTVKRITKKFIEQEAKKFQHIFE